jgi:hypothetical protein
MIPGKRNTGELARAMASQFDSLHKTIIGAVVLLIVSALPLAALVVGSLRINECVIQRMIPIWLLVVGAVGVIGCGTWITIVRFLLCE